MARGNARTQPAQKLGPRPRPMGSLRQEPVQPPPIPPPPRVMRGRRTRQDSQSGESIHFSNLSETSDDDGQELQSGQDAPPRSHSPASIEPNAGSSVAPTRPASPDLQLLVLPPLKGSRRHQADDILHFFNRGSKAQGTSTICKRCK